MNLIDKDKLLEALAEAQKQPCVSLRKLVEEQPVYRADKLADSFIMDKYAFKYFGRAEAKERMRLFFTERMFRCAELKDRIPLTLQNDNNGNVWFRTGLIVIIPSEDEI